MTASYAVKRAAALGTVAQRAGTAAELARAAGAERLVVLLRDPVLGVFLPAPGLPQTLRGGPLWRDFVARCVVPGRHRGEVDLAPGAVVAASALTVEDLICVFIGGAVPAAALDELEPVLPLLAATLKAEQRILFTTEEFVEAKRAAGRAEALAKALEVARAEQARLNAELTTEHRRKDEFLAVLAHELRNPLAPMRSALDYLSLVGSKSPEAVEVRAIIGRQVDQMVRLIDDLLEVSRISQGKIELQRMPVDVSAVVLNALEATRPLLESARHTINVTPPPVPLTVVADAVRLGQVFSNLITNAAKYTDPGGMVSVRVAREAREAVITVEDNGIGIDPAMLERVFGMLVQLEGAGRRARGGLGIGLSLARRLVELHGGRISARSEGPGKGSAFEVRLPVAEVSAPKTEPAADWTQRRQKSRRILVVDDNADAAQTLALLLQSMGHAARAANSGPEALEIARADPPELMLIDIGMPLMDGFEVAQRVRSDAALKNVQLVALTGFGRREDIERSTQAGFDEHLVKPVAPEVLQLVLAGVAGSLNSR